MLIKSHNHDHYWSDGNFIYETYNTLRGRRYRPIVEFDYPEKDFLTDEDVEKINKLIELKKINHVKIERINKN